MALRRRMPARRRRIARRRRGMRRIGRRRINKTMNPMKDVARVVEVYSSIDLSGNTGYVQAFTLSEFARALQVSKNYRFYRCTKVDVEFIPYANLFAPGQAFPELYYQQDATAILTQDAPTQASMEGRGVLPIKWTSPVKRSYSPAVLRYEQMYTQAWKTADGAEWYLNDVQPLSATPVKYKWYMTQKTFQTTQQPPNSTNLITEPVGPAADPTKLIYGASSFFLNTPVVQSAAWGRVVIKAHWEFKQPLVPTHSDSVGNQGGLDISGNNIFLQKSTEV